MLNQLKPRSACLTNFLFAAIALSAASSQAQTDQVQTDQVQTDQVQTDAESAYNQGNCRQAITLFQTIINTRSLPEETRNKALFKKSYCHLSMGHFQKARIGFIKYLKTDSNNLEARLRYAQASAQLHRYDSALRSLDTQQKLGAWQPEYDYWRGIAYYGLDNYDDAKEAFENCKKKSTNTLWTKKACADWHKTVSDIKPIDFFYVRGGLGLLSDTNVARGGTKFYTVTTTAPIELSSVTETSEYILKDRGNIKKIGLDLNWIRGSKLNLTSSFDLSYTEYSQYTSYNFQANSAYTKIGYALQQDWLVALGASIIDSRYRHVRYQDYWTLSPSVTRFPNKQSALVFGLDHTSVFYGTKSKTTGVKATYLLYPQEYTLQLELALSRTTGQPASISGTPVSVDQGSTFSNYSTTALTATYTQNLFWKVSASPSFTLYYTRYDQESFPENATTYTRYYTDQSARKDVTIVPGLSLSMPVFVPNILLSASYTLTLNRSSGMQGIASSGSISDNSYKRGYGLLEMSFWY